MIEEEHLLFPDLAVQRACALLAVARCSYYRGLVGPVAPAEEAVRLRDAIERSIATLRVAADQGMVLEFPGYGYRRVTQALQREDWKVNHKRVLRSLATLPLAANQGVMREESLLCQLQRRWTRTTTASIGSESIPTC